MASSASMTLVQRQQLATEGSEDSRLGEALKLLAREPISVLSLDVFDTLVWRAVPEPVDAFILLGRRLRELGHLAPHLTPHLFARLRETAEVRARDKVALTAPSREVPLEAIYEQMPPHLTGSLSVDDLAAIEVDLEREICFPDLDVLRLAQLAQDSGVDRVVLVSDTYFSEKQMRRVLDRDAFEGLGLHKVFTSSDHKRSKASGLYRTVLEDLDVAPAEVLHIGDHAESDVASAAKEGIHTVHFPKLPDELRTVLEREGVIPSGNAAAHSAPIDQRHGDLGLTAMRSKAVSRSEAARLPDGVRDHWEFGASVLGPVFTGFAEWIHRRTQEEGVDVVHCLMREGQFVSRLVDGARHYLGSPVRAEAAIWDRCPALPAWRSSATRRSSPAGHA